jgi:hypothetical protein
MNEPEYEKSEEGETSSISISNQGSKNNNYLRKLVTETG